MNTDARSPQPHPRPTFPGQRTSTVVIGLDGSTTSWGAFWWGCGEAKRLGRRIVAVFVSSAGGLSAAVTAAAGVGACDIEALERAATQDAERIRAQLDRAARDHEFELTFIHARGDAAVELLRVAKETAADIIVVGRSEKTLHQLIGSIGGRLIASRDAPVVVVVP